MVGCLIVTSVYTFVARSLVGQDAPNMSVADPESTSGIPFLKGHYPTVNLRMEKLFLI